MILPAHIDHATTLAQTPSGRIGKRFVWASDEVDGVWRHKDARGRWVKPSDVGAGADTTARRTKYHFRVLQGAETIEWRRDLRTQLVSEPSLALIAGVYNPELYGDLTPQGNHLISPAMPRKAGQTLIDAPRAWFTVDLDGLDLSKRGFDAYEHDPELPDILADIWDECGLDWLITDCVIQLSSSYGLIDRTTVKVHIDWHLKDPLTLAEQKILARYINTKVRAAGIAERLLDETVYDPARLLFTSLPELQRRVWMPGTATSFEPVAPPHLQRVRLVSRGQGRLTDIPDEALDELRVARAVRKLTGARLPTPQRTDATLSLRIEPGNVYAPIRARIYKAAKETPAHRAEDVKRNLQVTLRADLEALPDHDVAGVRRMRYLADDEFNRSWNGALEQRYSWRICTSQSSAYPAAVPIETARLSLSAHMRRAIADGIEYAHQAQDGAEVDPPKHLLLRSPPGVGKTQAVIDAITVGQLMSERISYLSPSTRLSEEATARMRLRVPQDDYSQSRVRHLRGRAQVCSEPAYGRLAEKVESQGISPIKSVCGYCPRRDACPWPESHGNTDSGFVTGQHAHAITSLAKIQTADADNAPAVGVIDESMLGTLLRQRQAPQKLATLKRWARRGAIKMKGGEKLFMASLDLVSYRLDVVTALESAAGVLSLSQVLKFSGLVNVKVGDEVVKMARIDAAAKAERDAARWYRGEASEALVAYHEARAAGRSIRDAERRLSHATAQLSIGTWFLDIYRAIKGSLSVPGRKHVFGVRITASKRVSVHIRTDLPTVMKDRHWIWLDGTADPEVWAALVKGDGNKINTVERRLDVMPGAYRLIQYPDRAYSKSMFSGGENSRSHIAKMHRLVVYEAMQHNTVLVVAQAQIEKQLVEMGLPENVSTEHYNALRGLDRYKGVSCAIIIGRPQPDSNALEALTEALHFDNDDVPAITSSFGGFHQEQKEIPIAGAGRPVAMIKAESHPDPRVRAMRRQIVDAEVRQAIMRLRLFDRTDANPAILHYFGQCDTGLIASELRDWDDASRGLDDILIAQGALSLSVEVARVLGGAHVESMADWTLKNNIMAPLLARVAWPTYQVRIDGVKKPCDVKVNAKSPEQAAGLLRDIGVSALGVRGS